MLSYEKLMQKAIEARQNAYAPYSGFKVGAALLTDKGKIYKGCNIENAAYGLCNCAERTAFFKAISDGERKFAAIAICGEGNGECFPCGACRQVMEEFCCSDFVIVLCDNGALKTYSLDDLLPHAFCAKNISDQKGE